MTNDLSHDALSDQDESLREAYKDAAEALRGVKRRAEALPESLRAAAEAAAVPQGRQVLGRTTLADLTDEELADLAARTEALVHSSPEATAMLRYQIAVIDRVLAAPEESTPVTWPWTPGDDAIPQ